MNLVIQVIGFNLILLDGVVNLEDGWRLHRLHLHLLDARLLLLHILFVLGLFPSPLLLRILLVHHLLLVGATLLLTTLLGQFLTLRMRHLQMRFCGDEKGGKWEVKSGGEV